MADDLGFDDRMAYVRWLRDMGHTEPEKLTAFAAAIGVKYDWLYKWIDSPKPPSRRAEIKALVAGLEAMGVTEDWLIDGKGAAPEPALWKRWLAEAQNPLSRCRGTRVLSCGGSSALLVRTCRVSRHLAAHAR